MNCLQCGKLTNKKCSICKCAYYCSKECQKNNWILHKEECTSFPISYTNTNQSILWICDFDDKNQITSVFINTKNGEKYSAYFPNITEVFKQKKILENDGWIKAKKPDITISFDK